LRTPGTLEVALHFPADQSTKTFGPFDVLVHCRSLERSAGALPCTARARGLPPGRAARAHVVGDRVAARRRPDAGLPRVAGALDAHGARERVPSVRPAARHARRRPAGERQLGHADGGTSCRGRVGPVPRDGERGAADPDRAGIPRATPGRRTLSRWYPHGPPASP
jgi:hypothetical protein